METYDLVIIGAGPAGLSAGIYAMERKLHTLILESAVGGGQLRSLYPDKGVYDFPSYPDIKASDLAQKILAHALSMGIAMRTGLEVTEINEKDGIFNVKTQDNQFSCRSIIIATGMGSFTPKKLNISGEDDLIGHGLTYQTLPEKVVGKRIVVVGGGDTAVEMAVQAAEKGASVMIVHRSAELRAMEKTIDKANSLSIPLYLSAKVIAVHGKTQVESVEIIKSNGSESLLSADLVCVCIGVELNSSFVKSLNLELNGQALKVDTDMRTSRNGIFACGDITVVAGRYKRISIAVGSSATAVNSCYMYLKNPYWKI